MKEGRKDHELYHAIFGSIIDSTEMNPYLLSGAGDYETALRRAARMMGNRGFDIPATDELSAGEKERAGKYVKQAYKYFLSSMFPFLRAQLQSLASQGSGGCALYEKLLNNIYETEAILKSSKFRGLLEEDPRHLLLLASSGRYPRVFYGYRGGRFVVPDKWQKTACSILKMAHLVKSIEEDSQDINDYAQLALFLESEGVSLNDLYKYDWHNPKPLPESEPARRALVKISSFFHKLHESIKYDGENGGLVFNSGDGVEVEIAEIKARLKSPESMFTKIGKAPEEEAHNIRDILAITFIIKNRDDTLKLFHALQKRGVILQENTISTSITQTLFSSPESMLDAVRSLMNILSRGGAMDLEYKREDLLDYAEKFYNALSANTAKNPHTSKGHRKFQCKINFCVPVHRDTGTNEIIVPGTEAYINRHLVDKKTEQHTLFLELRISDEESWHASEQKGDSHHDAYKFRQLISVMNRIFKGTLNLPEGCLGQLREDQKKVFG